MPDPRDDVARLCLSLRDLRAKAPTAELDDLVTKARTGAAFGADLTDLLRACDVTDPAPQLRGMPVAILHGPGHFRPDEYVCPVGRCSRSPRRRPGQPRPFCELEQLDMRRIGE